jgi:aminoglycoside/choline kinase family phosphotransferase
VLCHRDYHRRNLMVTRRGGRASLTIIDHQDTRLGPRGYDLASFLFDSYGDFSAAQRRALARRAGIELADPDFRRVALQRALKALGTFGYQLHEKKNRRYAAAIPRTLAHARDHLRVLRTAGVEFPALDEYLQTLP